MQNDIEHDHKLGKKYCSFWRYQNMGAAVLVGAIPEKFSTMKNLCFFVLSEICFHHIKWVPHESEIMTYLLLPLSKLSPV